MVAISSKPYLTSDFAFLPCFRIFIGLIFISLCSPTRYAHTRAMQTIATSLAMRSISRIWVSSMLKPEDFMALKAVSISHRFLYVKIASSGRFEAYENLQFRNTIGVFDPACRQDRHTHLCEERAYGRISPDRPSNH